MKVNHMKYFTICRLIIVLTIKMKEIQWNISQNVVTLRRKTNKVLARIKRVVLINKVKRYEKD